MTIRSENRSLLKRQYTIYMINAVSNDTASDGKTIYLDIKYSAYHGLWYEM